MRLNTKLTVLSAAFTVIIAVFIPSRAQPNSEGRYMFCYSTFRASRNSQHDENRRAHVISKIFFMSDYSIHNSVRAQRVFSSASKKNPPPGWQSEEFLQVDSEDERQEDDASNDRVALIQAWKSNGDEVYQTNWTYSGQDPDD